MKRVLMVASGVVMISTATASAGGLVGLSIGTQPGVNQAAEDLAAPSGRSLRVLGGITFGKLAVEVAFNHFGVVVDREDRGVSQLSLAGKYNFPLGNDFEAFGRAGLEQTWLGVDDERYDFSGKGPLLGGGFEYKVKTGVVGGALFVDYTIRHVGLRNSRDDGADMTSRTWSLGFLVDL